MKNSNLFNIRFYCCTNINGNLITCNKLFSYIFLLLLLTLIQNAYCQTTINGSIKDSQGHPLAFANVLLLQQVDSTLVKGVISDEKGKYFISEVIPGSYLVSSSMIGFRTMYSLPLSIKDDGNSILDFTLPEAISELSEVVIKASKPLFEQQMDKLVVNVKSSIISSGSTVLEVLARTPGVSVNQQNQTITMNGKEGVMIMLNGNLMRLPLKTVVQMLSGMNADQVEKIEIITSPSARYDAEGNAGLINIVNSKVQDIGTNGSFSGNLGYGHYGRGYERYGGSFNLNHRTQKMSFYVDYSGMLDHFLMFSTNERNVQLAGVEIHSSFQGERDFRTWTHNARSGIEWAISPNTSIGSQFTAFSNKQDQIAYNRTVFTEAGLLNSSINVIDHERNHWWNYAANLNITHNINSNQSISADADYLYYYHNNPHNYNFSYHFLHENQREEEQLVNSKHTPIHMWVGKIDYQNRINDFFSIEAGVKGFLSDVDNEIVAKRSREGIWSPDTLMSQHVLMEENIGAAYLSLNTTLDAKTKLMAGLRYEHTYTNLHHFDYQPILERNYGNFFPSFSFSRDVNQNNSLQLSYSRRITRPTFNDLAPFLTLLDPFTFFSGNMELLPSLSHSLQTNYQFKKDYQLTFNITDIKNAINWDILVIPEQNLQLIQTNNFDNTLNLSLTLSAPNNFTSWWEGQTSILGVRQQIESVSQKVPVNRAMQYVQINTTQTMKLGSGYSAELSGFFQSRSLFGLMIRRSFGSLNMGIQKELKNNLGTLKLSGEDLLYTQIHRFKSYNSELGFEADFEIRLNSRLIRLTYSRNFGSKNLKSVKRETGSEEERRRVQ